MLLLTRRRKFCQFMQMVNMCKLAMVYLMQPSINKTILQVKALICNNVIYSGEDKDLLMKNCYNFKRLKLGVEFAFTYIAFTHILQIIVFFSQYIWITGSYKFPDMIREQSQSHQINLFTYNPNSRKFGLFLKLNKMTTK